MTTTGMFKNRYAVLKGKGWLASLPLEDRRIFASVGRSAVDALFDGGLSRLGGIARARTGIRDSFGRFWNKETRTKIRYWQQGDDYGEVYAERPYSEIHAEAVAAFSAWRLTCT